MRMSFHDSLKGGSRSERKLTLSPISRRVCYDAAVRGLRSLALVLLPLGAACNGGMSRRTPEAPARVENAALLPIERAVTAFLATTIERARKDRRWKSRLPAACPLPQVDWEVLQLTEMHVFPAAGIGDAMLMAIAKPRKKGADDDRTCAAKIAFRYREDPAASGVIKIRATWLSAQPEPVLNDDQDDEEDDGDGGSE